MQDVISTLIVTLNTRPPAASGILEDVESALGIEFPEPYRRLMTATDGAEGRFGMRYLALYSLEDVVKINKAAQVDWRAPGLVMFGSDLGGVSYAFDTRSRGLPIVEVDDETMSLEGAKPCGNTFAEFLEYVYSTDY